MFLTQEDYRKIESWLKLNSKKDTDFDFVDSIDGSETIAIVLNNKNKRISIDTLLGNFIDKDFINVTNTLHLHGINLETAIHSISIPNRKEGLIITFEGTDSNWYIYLFVGNLSLWYFTDLWKDILNWETHVVESVLPDNEDLATTEPDEQGNTRIKFADREYNPDSFSGLGHIILRKNLVEVNDPLTGKSRGVINFLYQDIINKENTVYEIRYDFDLNGLTIILPNNCILNITEGSINNGIIQGNNTQIVKNLRGSNLQVLNLFKQSIDLNLYKEVSDSSYSDTLLRILDIYKAEFIDITLDSGVYVFDKEINIYPTSDITPYFSIHGNGYSSIIKYNGPNALFTIHAGGGIGIDISRVLCKGNGNNTFVKSLLEDGGSSYFLYLKIKDCFIRDFSVGVDIKRGYSVIIDRCDFRGNGTALKLNCANHTSITNCNFPYNNTTCIEFDNSVVPASSEHESISVFIQGCRFEATDLGIHFKEIWCCCVEGCYFEPRKNGHSMVIEKMRSGSFIGNYSRYDRYIDVVGPIAFISFILNNMSINFKEGCSVVSMYLSNYDYSNFTITGITNEIAANIYDDSIAYNKCSPQNIIRPNLINQPEILSGKAEFSDGHWDYIIADKISYGKYFYLYNISISSGNSSQRVLQIKDKETLEILFEYSGIDPLVSSINKPLFKLLGNKVKDLLIVLRCLTYNYQERKPEYHITYSRLLY